MRRTAFLIDGGFFLKRLQSLCGSLTPNAAARKITALCMAHLEHESRSRDNLYRIFYYDCPPVDKKAHNPITKRAVDFGTSPTARWRTAFFEQLKVQRKVALRLGRLAGGSWQLRPEALKDLLSGARTVAQLTERDVSYDVRQKAVDMRIGLDIASLAYKKCVDQIVLFSGDSDFVPAAKLARREGIDFILDPMWFSIGPDLNEHIDGKFSPIPSPKQNIVLDGPSLTPTPPIVTQVEPETPPE